MTDAEWSYASLVPEGAPTREPAAFELEQVGPFAVEAELGRGGMGRVLRVRFQGTTYALKLLLDGHEAGRLRLEREAQLVGSLDHPGIVRLHGAGRVDGQEFLLYALVPNAVPLSAAWESLPLGERVELIAQVADAVGYAHSRGVVHRDLKPDNVLLDGSGAPRVIDFGLATHASLDAMTQTGAWVGTADYMAPEQFSAERSKQRPQVDVWSLGVLLYQALSGRLPYQAVTTLELLALLQRSPTPPSSDNPQVEPWLEKVCLRALSHDPSRRQADGVAFARELRGGLAGSRVRGGARRGKLGGVLAGLLALAVVGGAFAHFIGGSREPRSANDDANANDVVDAAAAESIRVLLEEGVGAEEALATSRQRLDEDPRDLSARLTEGAALLALGDYAAGEHAATELLRDHPHQVTAHQILIGALYRQDRLDEAWAACQRGLAVAPESQNLLVYASLVEIARGGDVRGLSYAERALAIDPGSAPALAARGLARLTLGRNEEALSDFNKALQRKEIVITRFNRATALFRLGRYTEALLDAERVEGELRTDPDWTSLWLQCLIQSRPEQAAQEARRLAEEQPELAVWHYLLGKALVELEDPEAEEHLERAARVEPDSDFARAATRLLERLR